MEGNVKNNNMDTEEMLEVIDEGNNSIGLETRDTIHRKGLLHREINLWFLTPKAEIIFQHRAKDKDTYPDKLDATVGGHVEPGMSYEETAIKECEEETGLRLRPADLIELPQTIKSSYDSSTSKTNNVIRNNYAYVYSGPISDLRIEAGKSEGFEAWPIDSLGRLSAEDNDRFVASILDEDTLALFKRAREILGV